MDDLTIALSKLNEAVSDFDNNTSILKEVIKNFRCSNFCNRRKHDGRKDYYIQQGYKLEIPTEPTIKYNMVYDFFKRKHEENTHNWR